MDGKKVSVNYQLYKKFSFLILNEINRHNYFKHDSNPTYLIF